MFFLIRNCVNRMHLIHNERIKLTATWLNTIATAFLAAGLFAPLAAFAYGIADWRVGPLATALLIALCIAVGVLLHWSGRIILGRLLE
jgi:type IV secretory pathway VirB2 component (pilin)